MADQKVNMFDSVGPASLQHIDIERQIQNVPSYRYRTATAKFVPSLFYYGCVVSTFGSAIFTASIAKHSSEESIACFSSTGIYVPRRQFIPLISIFLYLYSIALRNIPTNHDHYFHSVFGFLCSIFYFVTAIYLTVASWECSNAMERIDVLVWIFLSFLWLMTWLYFTLTCFYLKYLKENPLRLLLFIRCVCIPPEVKKVILVFPYILTAGVMFINSDRLRGEECTLPLNAYSMITASIIFLIGMIVASILFFGREHSVLEADREDNESNAGLDNTTDSAASTEMILLARQKKSRVMLCTWLTLRVVFQMAGLLHIVAFIWASIGVFWQFAFSDMQCNAEIKQAAIASEFCLFFVFFADVAVFYIFKIEGCFPSILDSKPFHSPFIEKGMKICKGKIEKARDIISPSSRKMKKEYSRVIDMDL